MSREAALVKLADKICNLRDVAVNPPAEWSVERRIEYFEWAKAEVDGLPQVSAELLGLFNATYAARAHCSDRK
jgi:guanosine-3',5'-bis(diphosphate) 3'-pyrophosphohydrolase